MKTKYNEKEIFQGWSDSPLTLEGKRNLKLFGDYFKKKHINKILSSPFLRCITTAKEIAKQLDIPIETKDALKEICYGSWEEQPKAKFKNAFIWKIREQNRFTFKHPGKYKGQEGESYQDLFGRLEPFWQKLKKNKENNILIVSHIGILMAAKKYFVHLSKAEMNQYRPPNNALLQINFENEESCKEILL